MAKNFIQNGTVIEKTVTADIASGTATVIGNVLGIALNDFKANEPSVFAIEGVFELPKAGGAINVGDAVAFDVDAGVIVAASDTLAAGDLANCGVAFSDAAAGVGTVNVKINITGSTITA